MIMLWMCAGLAVAVFAVMLYSVATFRSEHRGDLAIRNRRIKSEVLWALVPILIFILAAIPVVTSIEAIR